MNYISINFWMACLLIGLVGCNNPQSGNTIEKEPTDQVSYVNAFKQFLGKPFSTLDIPSNLQKKDTTFEAEDGTTWPGLIIFQNEQVLFWVETSWIDTINIRTLTIVSPQITFRDSIHVNSKFADIKSYLCDKIPSAPDGYFYLKDKLDNRIYYYFDIEGFPELSYRQPQFDSIPADLVIKSIVLY